MTQGTKEEESKALKNISDNQESSEESRYPPSPNDRRLVEAHPLTSETSGRATIDNECSLRREHARPKLLIS